MILFEEVGKAQECGLNNERIGRTQDSGVVPGGTVTARARWIPADPQKPFTGACM